LSSREVHGELAAGHAAEHAEEERRTTDAEAAAGSDAAAATTDAGKSYEGGLAAVSSVFWGY